MIEVRIPDTTPQHVQIGNRLKQQVEDALAIVRANPTPEAHYVLEFASSELRNLVNLYG